MKKKAKKKAGRLCFRCEFQLKGTRQTITIFITSGIDSLIKGFWVDAKLKFLVQTMYPPANPQNRYYIMPHMIEKIEQIFIEFGK